MNKQEEENLKSLIDNLQWHINRCDSGKYSYTKSQYDGAKYMIDQYKQALDELRRVQNEITAN